VDRTVYVRPSSPFIHGHCEALPCRHFRHSSGHRSEACADTPHTAMPPPSLTAVPRDPPAATPLPEAANAPQMTLEEPRGQRLFYKAPLSVSSLAAAMLEPALAVLMLYGLHAWYDEPFGRASTAMALLVITLTFPGRDRFNDRPLRVALGIASTWAFLVVTLMLSGYATRSFGEFEPRVIIAWLVATPFVHWLAVIAGGAALRRLASRADASRHAVIVGGGALGIKAAAAIAGRKTIPTKVVGYFDDRTDDKRLDPHASAQRLGRLDEVARYVDKLGIREVYITLPLGSQPRTVKLLESLRGTTASVFFVPDVIGISIIQGRLQDVNGVPVVGICETPFTGTNELAKRISDMVISLAVLVLATPPMLAIALAIKLTSPGPVIFKQRRNGLDGEEIIVYKFRSMRVLENGGVIKQTASDDERVTPIGRILRRTSLDELPQFINVLQGRMSIVGPRPHAVAHNVLYRRLITSYMVRHKARPGITGWAQINGFRGETDTLEKMSARVQFDLEYLRNWSLGLDLRIMARTLSVVFAGRNAH